MASGCCQAVLLQVTCGRGNNLHEVETCEGAKFLVSMPTKFRKSVWIKRGKRTGGKLLIFDRCGMYMMVVAKEFIGQLQAIIQGNCAVTIVYPPPDWLRSSITATLVTIHKAKSKLAVQQFVQALTELQSTPS